MYKIGSDAGRIIVGEYGRHLEGEYVRRRLRVKALGMEHISVAEGCTNTMLSVIR